MILLDRKTKSVVLRAEDPLALRDLIPGKSRIINHPDYNMQVQHTFESTRLLRNIGFDVPSPIMTGYNWPGKYKPFAHQETMADFMTMNQRCFNLSEMGVGKTAASLWAADFLMQQGIIKKCLILSPLSTLERVWTQDIFDVLMHRKTAVVHGSREQRMKALSIDADFYILNHDGVTIPQIWKEIKSRPDIQLVIVDEASMFRNHDTDKYKALTKMLRPDVWLWMLTGTPCPNWPTDAWALARLVSPAKVPPFFGSFKRQTMLQVTTFKWVPRHGASDMAFDVLQPAVRFEKKQCMDLPPVTVVDHQAPISRDQARAFKTMKEEMYLEHIRTSLKGETITAVNAADKINKLRQVLCGSIKDPSTETYVDIDHAGRTRVLLDAIEQASAKVIIVVPFKGIIQSLGKELAKHHTVGILNGDVSVKLRNQTIVDFKFSPNPRVLLCHPKVMAHGLNLTEADMMIFYAPIYSNDEFRQVIERFNRTGQTRNMTVVRIGAHPLEWDIYKMVDGRQQTQQQLLDLYVDTVSN
jgi:SNF2 family DNA or RNA helicase